MKAGLNINLKQSQKLVMTQSLRQSIEMLQMSAMELSELITQEFMENPMLEDVTSPRDEDLLEDIINQNLSGESNENLKPEGDTPENSYDADTIKEYDEDGKRDYLESVVSKHESLKEHLLWQAKMTAKDEDELTIYEEIITLLDDDGFLKKEDYDSFSGNNGEILKNIHYFDPVGCATSDIKESLIVQTRYFFPEDSLLLDILEKHFEDLEKLDYAAISKSMELPLNEVVEKSKLLQNLNPFPGRSFSKNEIKYIIPDLEVKLMDGEIIITLNEDWIPNIRLSNQYMNLLKNKNLTKEQQEYLNNKLQSAKILLKNIEGRRETILKVVRSIMNHQRAFLEKGPGNLKYLTHHEVAKEVNVHESTVSRVCNNKYVQTPWGTYELKYFFVSRIKGASDVHNDEQSSDLVKGLIQSLIASEDPENPYSDEELVNILKEKGVTVARRTVAKYRDMLNIPASGKRKKINMIKS
ncbi:MAG TPA: RNA polymerase factor sigma-54 [Spirochaetota bacterium]|nr:RNA polymerase factor sigma-54 [Spirochaetota bacterium]HOK91661.1 RNA polymerase factor sigma-54 [Spirochaetota bacterium]HPP95961.1 RNA polymerase factor sigma-54 [Spirochaetota bacterium]